MSFLDPLDELRSLCAGVRALSEGGHKYFDLPALTFMCGGMPVVRDALLSVEAHSGYTTRLFLSEPVPKGTNWTAHVVLGRTWHTWSWNNVPANQRPAQILAQHLRALL